MGAIISTTNFADSATITANAGTFSRPLTELQKPWGRGLCRGDFAGMAVVIYDVDLGATRDIVTCGVVGFQGTGEVRFFLSQASDFSTTVAEEIVTYNSAWGFRFGPGAWFHSPSATPWQARYVRVRVDVFEGSPTWVDQRRLWIGGGLILPAGVSAGWSVEMIDGSASERTSDGGVYVDERTRWRRLSAGRARMSEAEAIGSTLVTGLWSELNSVGRSGEIVAAVRANPGTDLHKRRYFQTVYGQLVGWSPLDDARGGAFRLDRFAVEEAPMFPLS
jgi:hypothetical protein